MRTNKVNGGILTYKFNKKTHPTMMKKVYISLYLEQRFTSLFTKVFNRKSTLASTVKCLHYTFEQESRKKDFTIMNQKLKQKTKIFV